MAIRAVKSPNVNISAIRGWCLKYVDDGVAAPKRVATAQISLNNERNAGRLTVAELPQGIWVPIFFSINAGAYKGLGHVAWALNRGNGVVEIHDSEVHAGARGPYTSIAQIIAWFGSNSLRYEGWSTQVDGAVIAEYYTPAPAPTGDTGRIARKGTATVLVDVLNVRTAPSRSASVRAQYTKGQVFTYDSYQVADGIVWLSYVSFSGVRSYVAEGPDDGNDNNVYVSGGV